MTVVFCVLIRQLVKLFGGNSGLHVFPEKIHQLRVESAGRTQPVALFFVQIQRDRFL